MSESPTAGHIQQVYEAALDRALRHAKRHLPSDQALEVAHETASDVVRRVMERPDAFGGDRPLAVYVRTAVMNRLRNLWRAARRRDAAERLFHEERSGVTPEWAMPGDSLDAGDLRRVIDTAIAEMPPSMRRAYLLVREEGLTYQEAADKLGIGAGTVHTQLSRAHAVLHRAIDRYRADVPARPANTANKLRVVS